VKTERVPWVVAIHRVSAVPGPGGGRVTESVHVFDSEDSFRAFAASVNTGRWIRVYSGDPRPYTPQWVDGDYEYAQDAVWFHGDK
jgi:hypothetical protein